MRQQLRYGKQQLETQSQQLQQTQFECDHQQRERQRCEQLLQQEQLQLRQSQHTAIAAQRDLEALRQRLSESQARAEQAEQGLDRWRDRCTELQLALATRQESLTQHQQQLEELRQSREQLKQEFQALANEIFSHKQQQFSEQNRQQLEVLLQPFQQQVREFRERVDQIHTQETQARAGLESQLRHLHQLNQQITTEAHNLTRALKGDRKLQGNWGELMLESVLERSGLREGQEYRREDSFTTLEGRLRPDAVIYLPDDKHLVVDAKVSLVAYSEYINAEDDGSRAAALKRHLESVSQHVKTLATKRYDQLPELNSPDFTFMFMPIEPAFAAAFQADPQLFTRAFEQHVAIVTPTTLLASLRVVASLWTIERQNRNAEEIARQAGALYDKLHGFVDSLSRVGESLKKADEHYQQAFNRLAKGRGNAIVLADQLRQLGAKPRKQLDSALVQDAQASVACRSEEP